MAALSKICHRTLVKDFNTVSREEHNLARAVKESVFIRVNDSTINRNIAKYNLFTYGIEPYSLP